MTRHSSASRLSSPPETYWLGRWFAAARREGLLSLLAPEVWHTLSALLSFTSREGRRDFTVDQLAVALGQPRDRAIARLEQLARTDWRGQPLATLERNPQGEIAGAVLAPIETLTGAKAPQPESTAADTENRAKAGMDSPITLDETPADPLAADLLAVGLNPDQIEWLVQRFPQERIRRQLDWLPARQARNPAALLIRAIEQNWSAPREAA